MLDKNHTSQIIEVILVLDNLKSAIHDYFVFVINHVNQHMVEYFIYEFIRSYPNKLKEKDYKELKNLRINLFEDNLDWC